jgi:hypothetical protein
MSKSVIPILITLATLTSTAAASEVAGLYGKTMPRHASVNVPTQVHLRASMNLAGENLLLCLDPTQNYLPLRSINVDPQAENLLASYDGCLPRHDLGRWWDAMLRLEATTGFVIPAHIEGAALENLHRYFDNQFHVLRHPGRPDDGFDHHSFRENLLALNALVRFRNSAWARQKGEAMVDAILSGATPLPFPNHVLSGRMIEAVVWFYEATGHAGALELADRLARAHLDDVTRADGSMTLEKGHMHSYLNTLRGLLLFGELTGQRHYIDRVAVTYDKTLRKRIFRSGFMPHDIGGDKGETSSPGDVAQIALWLATRHGYTELFDDVERIVRARILPSQVTEPVRLKPREETSDDKHRDLETRILGGYGGCHRQPHGWKIVTTDVTAADIHTLVDIHDHIAVVDESGIRVNFHFDYEDASIRMESDRRETARVELEPRAKKNLLVRIPRWVPPDSVSITVDGTAYEAKRVGDFVLVSRDVLPAPVVMTYALPVRVEKESIAGVDYEFWWRGDEVLGVRPNDGPLPFYPTYVPNAGQ